jgi:hypothetical protein
MHKGWIVCNDYDACTTDSCDSKTSCQYKPVLMIPAIKLLHVTHKCDDYDACTTDSCDSKTACQYKPVICDDRNLCTTDKCVEGSCVFTHLSAMTITNVLLILAVQKQDNVKIR